ncbi:hypothetical protein [Streptomyces sp. SCSIO ZS0520]|uniref:hypothetical protein n=1 Tax=Streptomyces sp. SCSIO ZS0520 TaxID=2892996 RepID=UPI0021DADDE8|nr:hypothetical protein [Streptomyces sp. SCSIO ZS0520]
MADIADVLKRARPREQTVQVCMRGDLSGEAERLTEELARVSEEWEPSDLAEEHPARAIAAQIKAVREEARQAEVSFRLRYIGDRAYSDLLAAHPSKDENEAFNSDTFPRALIAACCVDPKMTEEQAGELFEVISQGEIKRLFDGAWEVHNGSGMVPFSLAASALLAGLGGEK